MAYTFREVRRGERGAVHAFAVDNGCSTSPDTLHHHLSLTVTDSEDNTVAAAVCLEPEPGRFVVEIVVGDNPPGDELIGELADRCLRKVQAEGIGTTRLHSPAEPSEQAIWSRASWLDKIDVTPPPGLEETAEAQAATGPPDETPPNDQNDAPPADQAA